MELVVLLAITATIVGLAGRLPEARRVKRDLARATVLAIDALPDGKQVTVRGTVELLEPDANITTPISRRACVYWLVTFDELGVGGDYVELGRSEHGRPFLLASPRGSARVVPDHPRIAMPGSITLLLMSDLDDSSRNDAAIRLARSVCKRPNYPRSSSLRVTEYALVPGMQVTIKGFCTREPDPSAADSVTGYRTALPMRPVISGTRQAPLLIG